MAHGDGDSGEHLLIGEVAREAGIRPSAIRYYERVGLLPPPARSNGRRRYPRDVLSALAVIKLAQAAGFSIREIRTLMTGFDARTPPSERWQALAARKLPEVEGMIERARAMKALLEEGMECECLRLEDCRPLERFR